MTVTETDFDSHGVRCGATHLTATSDALTTAGGRPCVVMGHGFGATRDAGLMPFAERFAAAGADVLLFDYRGYGTSGGHVIAVAAQDGKVAAVISQGAGMDGAAALTMMLRTAGPVQVAKLTGHALRDAAGALLGRAPHHVAVVGMPGSLAAITAPGAELGYQSIMGPTFRNEMCARGILGIALNRPVTFAAKLRCPLLLVMATEDNVAPPSAVRTVGEKAGGETEVLELECGHFAIYTGIMFDKSVAAQVDFLTRQLV